MFKKAKATPLKRRNTLETHKENIMSSQKGGERLFKEEPPT